MIRFTNIKWRNFLSTGNQFTEIQLDKTPSTLIIGENGAGKSTILDALCFVLFGKAFRNINKPQLVNSINNKNTEVQIEFTIGKKEYRVIRGMKPGIFEIYQDGQLLSQDAASKDYQNYFEDKILKLNYKSFTQIVILGSASFTPFMQLPQGHRREIIEDILDIQIFTTMNQLLKNRMNELKEQLRDIEADIEVGKQKVKLQQDYINQLEEDKKKRETDVEADIQEATAKIQNQTSILEDLQNTYYIFESEVSDELDTTNKRTEFGTLLKSLSDRIKKARNEILFYEENDNCPTCDQHLPANLKTHAVEKHSHKIEEVNAAIDTINSKIEKIENRLDEISRIKKEMVNIQQRIVSTNNSIITEQGIIRKLQENKNSSSQDIQSIQNARDKLKEMAKAVLQINESKSKLKENSYYYEAAATLLKDTGIKTKIIRQYLPVINKLVNKYLSAMDFFVSFELDEAFNESIKSRHRDDFSYASFSEGEKQRIDLALLFTWRTIAKMKNSASTNLLLLDEVFDSSLDANGTEFVMNLLSTIGEDTNVFVISHKGDQLQDKFASVFKFEKHQNFSRVV
jgi:DNA repair exonuclease SbcCD ATPase subunit